MDLEYFKNSRSRFLQQGENDEIFKSTKEEQNHRVLLENTSYVTLQISMLATSALNPQKNMIINP